HGGGPRFFQVALRPLRAHYLPHLQPLEPVDQNRSEHEGNQECGKRSPQAPKRYVTKDVEYADLIREREQKVVEHFVSWSIFKVRVNWSLAGFNGSRGPGGN